MNLTPRQSAKSPAAPVAAPMEEILNLIRSGQIKTRKDIADKYGIALSTVTLRVKDLLRRELITEVAGPSHGGRPTKILSANADELGVLVVDLTPGKATIGIMTLKYEVHQDFPIDINLKEGPEATIARIVEQIQTLPWSLKPKAIAVIVPGPVDIEQGFVILAANLPQWHAFPFVAELTQQTGLPTLIENDANCLAFAHNRLFDESSTSTLTLQLDYGLGGGIVANNDVFRGADGLAGDFSHSEINHEGAVVCTCGKTNCLDTLVSGRAIIRRLQKNRPEITTLDQAISLAQNQDNEALQEFILAGEQVSAALSILVNMLNPGIIFLSGRMCQVEQYVSNLKAGIFKCAYPGATKNLKFNVRQGSIDTMQGAAILCIERLIPELDISKLL